MLYPPRSVSNHLGIMKQKILKHASIRVVLAALILFSVARCADTEEVYVDRPVEDLYNEAMNFLQREEYKQAATAFDEVERQHPYSVWATKAQLMSAYTYYQGLKYDEAVVALNRFIQLHPGHRDVAYAYYLKALCYYEQVTDVSRDQKVTDQAAESLRDLVTRFPNSPYARDARLKLDLTLDHLAGKEMEIGRFYLNQRGYLAAINRFNVIITQFQTTTHVPEALHRLVECYLALGLVDDARKAAAVLGYNFPGNEWYMDAYKELVPSVPVADVPSVPIADVPSVPSVPQNNSAATGQHESWFGWLW